LILDVTKQDRYHPAEFVRLLKMVGSSDVALESRNGLIQLDFQCLVDAVRTIDREERRSKWPWPIKGLMKNGL